MNQDSFLTVSQILFITNIVILLIIIAPIMFQVYQILKRFNRLLTKAEQVTNDWNKKGEEILSFVTSGKILKLIKNLFKNSKEKGE